MIPRVVPSGGQLILKFVNVKKLSNVPTSYDPSCAEVSLQQDGLQTSVLPRVCHAGEH